MSPSKRILLVTTLCMCAFALQAFAQSADAPSDSTSGDASTGSAPVDSPVRGESATGVPANPGAPSAALEASPSGVIVPTSSPRSVPTSTVTPVQSAPKPAAPALVPPKTVDETPATPLVPIDTIGSTVPAPESAATTNIVPVAIASATILSLGGFLLAARAKKKKKNEQQDPCAKLKQRFEESSTAYDLLTRNITLQELLIAELKKEIAHIEERVKGEVKEFAHGVASDMKDELLAKEKSGILKDAVGLAEETKAAYDDLSKKYTQAKELLEVLKGRRRGAADEVRERKLLFNVCMEGAVHARKSGDGGRDITLPDARIGEKVILLDGTIVVEGEGLFTALHELLETYPNRKIILTEGNNEQIAKFSLDNASYELFAPKRESEKIDSEYYNRMLTDLDLRDSAVVCVLCDGSAAKSAQSAGITAYHYDSEKKDLPALRKFLDEQL